MNILMPITLFLELGCEIELINSGEVKIINSINQLAIIVPKKSYYIGLHNFEKHLAVLDIPLTPDISELIRKHIQIEFTSPQEQESNLRVKKAGSNNNFNSKNEFVFPRRL